MIPATIIIRQAFAFGRREADVKSFYAALHALPHKGDIMTMDNDGGRVYEVLAVCHEFGNVDFASAEITPSITITLTPASRATKA